MVDWADVAKWLVLRFPPHCDTTPTALETSEAKTGSTTTKGHWECSTLVTEGAELLMGRVRPWSNVRPLAYSATLMAQWIQ